MCFIQPRSASADPSFAIASTSPNASSKHILRSEKSSHALGAGKRRCRARNARARVVIDLHDEVIQVIFARQPVAWLAADKAHRPVVVAGGRVFAPGIVRTDGSGRQQGFRPDMTIGPPPQLPRVKNATGVPPSPSRLFALIPPRPSATGIVHPSAVNQPRRGLPAARFTRTSDNGRPRTNIL